MGLLPDKYNCELRIHRECGEPQVSDPDIHHDTCVTRDACRDRYLAVYFGTEVARKTSPAFPATAQFAILRIWQEAYSASNRVLAGVTRDINAVEKNALCNRHLITIKLPIF